MTFCLQSKYTTNRVQEAHLLCSQYFHLTHPRLELGTFDLEGQRAVWGLIKAQSNYASGPPNSFPNFFTQKFIRAPVAPQVIHTTFLYIFYRK